MTDSSDQIMPRAYVTAKLDAALVAAQAEFKAVDKDTPNLFFKSSYADLPAIKEAAQPVLARHGLAVTQQPGFIVMDGKIHDTLTTVLVHESGERDECTMVLKPVKNDPQAQGSAITYAKRYAFQAVLGIVADVDDDGNVASGRGRPAASRTRTAQKSVEDAEQAKLNKANDALKAAAKEAGVDPKEVVAYYKSEFGEALQTTRNVGNLEKAADHYRTLVAKDKLGGTEVE